MHQFPSNDDTTHRRHAEVKENEIKATQRSLCSLHLVQEKPTTTQLWNIITVTCWMQMNYEYILFFHNCLILFACNIQIIDCRNFTIKTMLFHNPKLIFWQPKYMFLTTKIYVSDNQKFNFGWAKRHFWQAKIYFPTSKILFSDKQKNIFRQAKKYFLTGGVPRDMARDSQAICL